MPVLYKHNEKEEVVKGDILLPITEISVISRSIKLSEPIKDDNSSLSRAIASIDEELEIDEDTPYSVGDIIRIGTSYKIRSSETKSIAMISLKDGERFKLVEMGQKLVRLDGNSTIEIIATVYETPNEYIQNGDELIEVTPLNLQIQ